MTQALSPCLAAPPIGAAKHRNSARFERPGEVSVPVESLRPSDSPRLGGENIEYTRGLAESDARLPPIVVHRPTMRVIDGMHRLRAAILRGERTIAVEFFEGDEKDAFVLAVKANNSHGLPLSAADRAAAAERIIASHPQWSDRAIASATGLAAKTVGGIRRRSTDAGPQLHTRIGRDGRVRPLNSADARRAAGDFLADNPDASLREIAKAAGISPGTARDVRARLQRGEDPVPPRQRRAGSRRRDGGEPPSSTAHCADQSNVSQHRTGPHGIADRRGAGRPVVPAARRSADATFRHPAAPAADLQRDPSLRFSETGRALLRMLYSHAMAPERWEELLAAVPPHSTGMVSDAARDCARAWSDFADQLEQRWRTPA
jgi:hypothetical protein